MDSLDPRHLPPPRVLTAADLAKVLDISIPTARRWLRSGRLPGVRIGRRWYASREAIVGRIEALAEPPPRSEGGQDDDLTGSGRARPDADRAWRRR
jgi:excisionase family DNA binding protein